MEEGETEKKKKKTEDKTTGTWPVAAGFKSKPGHHESWNMRIL